MKPATKFNKLVVLSSCKFVVSCKLGLDLEIWEMFYIHVGNKITLLCMDDQLSNTVFLLKIRHENNNIALPLPNF